MRELWSFTTREKMDKFIAILQAHDMECEISSAVKDKYVIAVNESDYSKAKRILLKHRERRTSGDSINSNDKNL
jgi:hypothetical protein